MRQVRIGDITIDAVIERERPVAAAAGLSSRPMTRPLFKQSPAVDGAGGIRPGAWE